MIQQLTYPVEDIARSDDIMTNDSEEIDYRYQPWEVVHHKEPKNKRYVLATDIYGFACIAWRMLSSIDSKPRCPRQQGSASKIIFQQNIPVRKSGHLD